MLARLAGNRLFVATPLRRLTTCKYTPLNFHRLKINHSLRNLSTEISDRYEQQNEPEERPRWLSTPSRMTAPVRSKPPVFDNEYKVNESQERLDEVFENVLGANGHRMLPKEVMWLTVTHKSFDHGRRGYNDRLAFFGLIQTPLELIGIGADTMVSTGRRIVNLQRSLALVTRSPTTLLETSPDKYGRVPFQHPALDGLQNLLDDDSEDDKQIDDDPRFLSGRKQIAHLADQYGLLNVIRWKPKNARNLITSGYELIISHALLAIVGAVALHKGGEVANNVVRERIFDPLKTS
ncbi:hypothetical protein MMC07_005629 [Pseudocyphellaria aurata]|nr:hypothetical protein [Pseudocyphellaria aurata]